MSIHEPIPARVAHLTSVHPRHDARIFRKECASLAQAGYEVHLVVADGKGDAQAGGVRVHDVGRVMGRLRRFALLPWRVLRQAQRLDASVYHFHDPELVPIGLMLHWSGRKVIYDSHEDLPRATLSKQWIRPWLRKAVAGAVELIEDFSARRFAAVVAATPHIAKRFARLNPRTVTINNYVLKAELESTVTPHGDGRTVCYIGVIGRRRGVVEMVQALEHVDARLIMAGSFESEATEQFVRGLPGWSRVDYRGLVSRAQTREIMADSCAGLLFFYPDPNHTEAQPNKMLEYMSAGLPVLASNFSVWKEILDATGAGLAADPLDPQGIAALIRQVIADPAAGREMGRRGREAVIGKYQWAFEEVKLAKLYKEVTQGSTLFGGYRIVAKNSSRRIVTVLGARPQFIKASVVSAAMAASGRLEEVVVHTGQHFDANMSDVFFRELGMAAPRHHLDIHGGGHGAMTGRMLGALEEVLQAEKPDLVLVYGDTNSTLAGALAAVKLHIPVAHVEAGLRSFNRAMPEEVNRILTDRISEWLFTPSEAARGHLLAEGVAPRHIVPVGDVMCDVARTHGLSVGPEGRVLGRLGLSGAPFVLATVHRAENTDAPDRLRVIVEGLKALGGEIPVVWPVHPRSLQVLRASGWLDKVPASLHLIDPVGYLDMVQLERFAAAVVTDSGGVQKEAFFHGVPCVTLRDETEWVELIESGWNRLVPPVSAQALVEAVRTAIGSRGRPVEPYGQGDAALKIVDALAGDGANEP